MTIYRVLHDRNIEATSAKQAEEILWENNIAATEEYFESLEAASARYAEIKATLVHPGDLGWNAGKHLYWFKGVALEAGYDCDDLDDGDTLKDAFNTAARWDGIDIYIKDFDEEES